MGNLGHIHDKNVFICHAEKDVREVVAHWEASCLSVGSTGAHIS